MSNLYILSEERPKKSVITQLILLSEERLKKDSKKKHKVSDDLEEKVLSASEEPLDIKIIPEIINGKFTFNYYVDGYSSKCFDKIIIKLSKGYSSFMDFLVFYQDKQPDPSKSNKLLFAVEETKTRDSESRNTGVYQRGTKFIFFNHYFPDTPIYMLYNDSNEDSEKQPSDTSIFGTNLYKNLEVEILGKDDRWFSSFSSIEDLINFKSNMRKPPKSNVPMEIMKNNDVIYISGILSKPKDKGNVGHDPNIGALSLISAVLRKLGWCGDIIITKHGVRQEYVNANKKNKFLLMCGILNIKLEGLDLNYKEIQANMPKNYWKYEESSEKIADIFLHLICDMHGIPAIYENHAGSERGYFVDSKMKNIVILKKNIHKELYYIPDVLIANHQGKELLLIEGKVYEKYHQGVLELENYTTFEEDYLKKYYSAYKYEKWVTLYSSKGMQTLPHEKVLLLINSEGTIVLNDKAPEWLKHIFTLEKIKF